MRGEYTFKVKMNNGKINYDLVIRRNITFIRGDSGTGKTTLIYLLGLFRKDPKRSGVSVITNANWDILNDSNWKDRTAIREKVIFIDEDLSAILTPEFTNYVKTSNNYFVIISRYDQPDIYSIPYSVNEVYELNHSNHYNTLKQLYGNTGKLRKPDIVITEDSNTGYNFFSVVTRKLGGVCLSAKGKNNIVNMLRRNSYFNNKIVLIIADGAAIGPQMKVLKDICVNHNNIELWLPESFEWLLLKSRMFKDNKRIQKVLNNPSDLIDTTYFSWERYFTELLIIETKNYGCKYSKHGELNKCYVDNCCCKNIEPCHYVVYGDKLEIVLDEKLNIFK